MNLISNVLTYCRDEWYWMTDNPMKGVKRPSKGEARDRRITQSEIDQICISCGYAEDLPVTTQQQRLAVAFLFAIETAMRLKEICNLMTDQVIERVAILPETKTTPRKVPLSSRAIELLEKLVPIDGYYFGGNSERYSALFRKIRLRTPIKDLTFHDTRHEAITRLAKKLDVLDLARMVGHKDLKMLLVYYNLSAEDLADKLG